MGHVRAAVLVIAASSLALPGALGVQQSETTGWIPLEFLVGLWISPRSGVLASFMGLGDEHSLTGPQPCSAFPSSEGLFNPAKNNFENFALSTASCRCMHLFCPFQPQVNEEIVN